MTTIRELTTEILAFRDERDWAQFHTPKNLAAALSIEAAELQQEFLWKSDEEIAALLQEKQGHGAVSDEIADVVIFAILFAESAGIDMAAAIRKKLDKNRVKYPVEKARGSAAKYTDFERD